LPKQDTEIFHGLFSDPGRNGPVAEVVSQLWGVSNAPVPGSPLLDFFKDGDEHGG
jgi:hypothetical protein